MSNIITPNTSKPKDELSEIPREEKEFQLMLHMHIQPSELERMSEEKIDWILSRFIFQMQQQQEMMAASHLRSQLNI